jgi:DNA-binding NarL/FixJ family response regulator
MLLPNDFYCDSAGRSQAPHLTVLIGGGHTLGRYGLRMFVAHIMGNVHHVEVEDLDSLMQTARSHPTASLALLDATMSGMPDGLRLLDFARRHPRIPLVVVTAPADEEAVHLVLDVPAVHAFVPSNASANALRAVIRSALRGKSLSRSVVNRSRVQPRASLTPRQKQIRGLLRQGMSNKMIACALGISTGTVKNHVSDIFRALNATNRTQAARLDAVTE